MGGAASARSGAVEIQAVGYRASTARTLGSMLVSFFGYVSSLSMLTFSEMKKCEDDTQMIVPAQCTSIHYLNLMDSF